MPVSRKGLRAAAVDAVGAAAYVALVASLMYNAPRFVGQGRSVLVPIALLLLFVFSAAFTGTMVIGRPALWYLDGRKGDAVSLFVATMAILLGLTVVALLAVLALPTR